MHGSALRRGTTNMDVPISIGVVLAHRHVGSGNDESRHTCLFRLGDHAAVLPAVWPTLDHAARRRMQLAEPAISRGTDGRGRPRLDGAGNLVTVPPGALRSGDLILVKPGETCCCRREVTNGASDIDDRHRHGRDVATPAVVLGAEVYAGSINGSGALTLRVLRAGEIDTDWRNAANAGSRHGGPLQFVRLPIGRTALCAGCASDSRHNSHRLGFCGEHPCMMRSSPPSLC